MRPSRPPHSPLAPVVTTRVVDLSGPITSGMWDYNALDLSGLSLPDVAVHPLSTVAAQGFSIHALRLTTLSGTYVETPGHTLADAPMVDDLAAASLIRPARVMRLPRATPRTLYRRADLEAHDPGGAPGEALILDTGWGSRWGTNGYVTEAPAFSLDTASWFADHPATVLAVDTPVMDCLWWDRVDPPLAAEQGRSLLGELYAARPRDLVLVAPLADLSAVRSDRGTLIALPLKVPGVPTTPCRVVFLEGVLLDGRG